MNRFARALRVPVLAGGTASAAFLLLACLLIIGALAAVYGRGISHSAVFVSDSFVFFDGIHRIANGQTPNADFWSPVGPLPYLFPYFGYLITGTYAGAVEMGSLLIVTPTMAAASVFLWKRTPPMMALLVLGTIAAVMVVPLVPGMDADQVSHAMHYNRWGWGILLSLLTIGLPARNGPVWGCAVVVLAGGLLAALFLIKITYFLVGSAYLLLLLFYPDQRRWLALGSLITAAGMLALATAIYPEMVFGYIASIQEALHAGKAVRGSYLSIAFNVRDTLLLLVLATYAVLLRPEIDWRDLVLVFFIVVSGIAIIDQNYQFKFIVTFPAAFALLVANARNGSDAPARSASVIIACAAIALISFALDWSRVTLLHIRAPQGNVPGLTDPRFAEFYIYENKPPTPAVPPITEPVDVGALVDGKVPITHVRKTDFPSVLEDGVRLLKSAAADRSEITTLDFLNTMPLMVDAPRTAKGYSWLHLGRNVGEDTLPDGATMFKGIAYIMVPLRSPEHPSVIKLLEIYGDYLKAHAEVVDHSASWVLLRHKPAG